MRRCVICNTEFSGNYCPKCHPGKKQTYPCQICGNKRTRLVKIDGHEKYFCYKCIKQHRKETWPDNRYITQEKNNHRLSPLEKLKLKEAQLLEKYYEEPLWCNEQPDLENPELKAVQLEILLELENN